MKTILILFALMIGLEGYTQNYYSKDYAKGANVTYKCTTRFTKKRLVSNITNQKVMSLQVLKNGSDAGPDFYRKICSNDLNNEKLYGIFRTSFTSAEIERLKMAEARLLLDIIIAPEGNILEVGFLLPPNSPLFSIKPDTLYQVEQAIKSQIHYTWDEKTRELYPWVADLMLVEFKKF